MLQNVILWLRSDSTTATHDSAFPQTALVHPSQLEEAKESSEALLERPHSEAIQPGDRHWAIFVRLCREGAVTGKLVLEAWFAALAIESGCEWITLDRGYARIPWLKWRPPE